MIPPKLPKFESQLPAQVADKDVHKLKSATLFVKKAAQTSIITSLILSFLMFASLTMVWDMIGSLQNISYMAFCNVKYPGNANSFMN